MIFAQKGEWIFCFEGKKYRSKYAKDIGSFLSLGSVAHTSFKDEVTKSPLCLVVVRWYTWSTETGEVFVFVFFQAFLESFEFLRILWMKKGEF